MSQDSSLSAFAHEVNSGQAEINLARAALALASFEYPNLNIQTYVERIDRLAEAAQPAMREADSPALGLAQFLFSTLGFSGNEEDYTDPRNSFLNDVIERRLGIPITLSVLFLEVARRVGVMAEGVGLPGHFIVCIQGGVAGDANSFVLYLDPFHRGALLSEEDCKARVQTITQGRLPFDSAFLNPVSHRYILTRMLNNLKNFYASANDFERAARVIERLLVLNPHDASEMRNLGLLYGSQGKKKQAVVLLENYLAATPDASDAGVIRRHIASLVSDVSRWN
jgi:regulator of sirC expression with transglutaminase-like and TPR domain